MPTRSALCISPPSTTWKRPFNRLFAESEGRSSGSDDFDPAGPRSASLGGGPGPERLAAFRGAPGRRLHRPLPSSIAAPRARRAQDGRTGLPPAHGRSRRLDDRRAGGHSTPPAPSWCCCGRRTMRRRPTWTASDGCHYERIGVLDAPEPVCLPEVGVDLREFRREQARHRCTMLLRCLGGVAISTALIGLFPGMHLAWVFTGLFGLAALGLAGAHRLRQGDRSGADPAPRPPGGRTRPARGSRRARSGDSRLPGCLGRGRVRGAQSRRTLRPGCGRA